MFMKAEQNYRTRSLILAGYILATGRTHLVAVDKSNPKEVFFVIYDTNLCEELVSAYWSDKALVNPKLLNTKLSELKDQIFN